MSTSDSQPIRLELSGQQLALYKALAGKDIKLAQMYHGALSVLSQSENTDRLALAAHGLRELMEKLPRYLDVPMVNLGEVSERIRTLNRSWHRTLERSACHNNGTWSGEIDGFLQKFLKATHEFFERVKDHPTWKQQAARILRKLDPLDRALPQPIENLQVKEWNEIRNYFVNVSHHNASADPEEFELWLSALERFLLERLIPRTFDDQTRIDEIIKEGEG